VSGRRLAGAITVLVSAIVGVLALELAFRIVDRQPLTRLALSGAPANVRSRSGAASSPDLQYLPAVSLAAGVDGEWYREEPLSRPRFPLDGELAARASKYAADPYTPFFEFNRRFVEREACAGRTGLVGGLDDFFVFTPQDGQPYPTFRHLAHVSPPHWFVTNNFGWRGPDVEVSRAPNILRIAFVGASTTIDSYSVPFSHPELIEHWLNRWAAIQAPEYRFEVINAGRTGIDSRSIRAIVETELSPVDPDLVVFYEGANQFTPGGVLRTPLRRMFPKPTVTFRERTRLERRSALVRRLLSAWDRARGGDGREPAKPPASVVWPAGVNESAPDPHDARLPMDLPQVVKDLDAMRAALAPAGGEVAVSSFIWLAEAGMRLDPVRHANILRYLNDTLWPISYAHVRRMADFQNRVFFAYATQQALPFLDIAGDYPRDPDLFDDPIHLNYAGLRLQGWIFLQRLVPIVQRHLSAHDWPRPPRTGAALHPAFAQPARRLMTASQAGAHCS
jgi:hypothetical protein